MTTRFLGALLALLPLIPPSTARAEEPPVIGTISVRPLNVFSPEEAERGWIYRLANSLRFQTRESTIRQFLLFKEGDPYNATRIEETERNLRALPFLKSATITVSAPHDGQVDVDVVTQDSWTTEPGISIGSKGGITTYSFGLKEKDFLGYGKQFALAYAKETERIVRTAAYRDPYLFGNYWNGVLTYANNSDGYEQAVRIGRPFYSFVTPWAADTVFDNLKQDERIWDLGKEISVFHQKHEEILLDYGRALVASDVEARRLTGGFHLVKDDFTQASSSSIVPDPRNFRYVFLRLDIAQNDFLKSNYVNRDVRYEDFDLGRVLSVEAGVSPEFFGVPATTEYVKALVAKGWRLTPRSFLQGQIAYETRFEGGSLAHEILSATGFFAYHFDTRMIQTLVSRLQLDRGWNLDKDVQFLADGDNGLRGYPLHSYAGNRRVLWNLEHRMFSGREYFQLVSPGLVVFFDAGGAVPEPRPFTWQDIKSDVGVGLRLSISRAASNSVVRIDLAYPLNTDPNGKRRFIVSFSSGQVF